MLAERRKVLTMLRDGKVSVEEAEQMIDLVARPETKPPGALGVAIVAESQAMMEVVGLIDKAARSDVPALIVGEAGTGKESVARAIHLRSSRSKGPFLVSDCTVLSGVVQQSEILGHEQGAFTGAVRQKAGLLETADGGTLFLVGAHALTSQLQAALEGVLKGRGYTRMGGSVMLYPDVRIIAATDVDLAKEAAEGRFRPYPYEQLGTVTIAIAPLRERKDDIPILARHFVDRTAARDQRTLSLSPEALDGLMQCAWPGNVRQLKNILQRAAVLCDGDVIGPGDLPIES